MKIDKQRQAIREGLAQRLYNIVFGNTPRWVDANGIQRGAFLNDADNILAFLTEKGAVLKVEGTLPEVDDAYKDFGGNDSIWEDSQQAMVDAGYTRTAPLIEPEKPH
ncbi:hypothetical protein LCGC14_0741050 [marine sediment metagenome]|uniref:Uncharacterized protein n=2 Tax=marine sediment metagenome TaxID=412755 RepID=A0A0F9Q6Q0_9ZZZZ